MSLKKILPAGAALAVASLFAVPALAEVSAETQFVFNTFSFLMMGALVMWMAAGFAMLESGLVRTKNTASICLKNIILFAIAVMAYYVIGYSLMYTDVTGWIGSFSLLYNTSSAEVELLAGSEDPAVLEAVVGNGYSVMSDWFFQVVFVATAASIVSGALAERVGIWPFFTFVVILSAFIYPIQGSWSWGGGWLSEMGFSDFAGSTLVHSVGGWAALVGALILGPRKGKYDAKGRVHPMPGSNLPMATLGTFILWLGWFGFNGGSQLALGSALDASAMAIVFTNTLLAACGGVVAAMLLTQLLYKKVDLSLTLNGAIGGLVAITAGPDLTNHLLSIFIGGIGGVLVVISVPLLDKLKIDDLRRRQPADPNHRHRRGWPLRFGHLRHCLVRHQVHHRPSGFRRSRRAGSGQGGTGHGSLSGIWTGLPELLALDRFKWGRLVIPFEP
jgi:Amt family ammonium transporter